MVSTTYLEPVAKRFLLITNILSAVKIEKLVVPEVVAIDCTDAVLECTYSGAGDDATVLWMHDGAQVYQWRRGQEPDVRGVLEGRLDFRYGTTSDTDGSTYGGGVEKHALRIVELGLELSGQFTCVVRSRGQEARATSAMTVFSPERDFELTFNSTPESDVINIKCVAKRLYPQPELTIEYNKMPVAQQQQRSWRAGAYFEAECRAALARHAPRAPATLVCRLHLPQVDYTAITSKYLHTGNISSANLTTATTLVIFMAIFTKHYII